MQADIVPFQLGSYLVRIVYAIHDHGELMSKSILMSAFFGGGISGCVGRRFVFS